MKPGPHLVDRCKVHRLLKRGNTAAVNDGHPKVVDPVVSNEIVCVPE
jgi:hypothetical protein